MPRPGSTAGSDPPSEAASGHLVHHRLRSSSEFPRVLAIEYVIVENAERFDLQREALRSAERMIVGRENLLPQVSHRGDW